MLDVTRVAPAVFDEDVRSQIAGYRNHKFDQVTVGNLFSFKLIKGRVAVRRRGKGIRGAVHDGGEGGPYR